MPTDRLLPIEGSGEQLVTLAIEPADANAPMVMILSPERLASLFFGTRANACEPVPAGTPRAAKAQAA